MAAIVHSPLQKILEKTVKKAAVDTVLSKATCELLRRHGIQLSKFQMERLARTIRSRNSKSLKIHLTMRQQKILGDKKLDLATLDPSTLESLQRDNGSGIEPPAILSITDSISALFESNIKSRVTAELQIVRRQQASFEKRLWRRWHRPLELLRTFVLIATEAGKNVASDLSGVPQLTAKILVRLHARGCQVANEIITLLTSGFADGAHARWRTLHELAVTAFFIAEHGDPLAERYALHQGIETFKAAELFQRYCKRLGYRSLTKRQYSDVVKRKDSLLLRFGKSFRGDYGWADSVIHNGHPTFRDIEEKINLDHIRPYYKLACNNVHAGAKGAFERLGLFDHEASVLLAGASSIGLADPGHGAALSLSQITTTVLLMEPSLDNLIVIRLLDRLQNKIGKAFLHAHHAVQKKPKPRMRMR